ncbi:MAG: hypothetical protein ACOCU6_02105 [Nanoarchaeota archaeon]
MNVRDTFQAQELTNIIESYREKGQGREGIDLDTQTIFFSTRFKKDMTKDTVGKGNTFKAIVPAYVIARPHESMFANTVTPTLFSAAHPAFWQEGVLKSTYAKQEEFKELDAYKGFELKGRLIVKGLDTKEMMTNSELSWRRHLPLDPGDALYEKQMIYSTIENATDKEGIKTKVKQYLEQANEKYLEITRQNVPTQQMTANDKRHEQIITQSYKMMTLRQW